LFGFDQLVGLGCIQGVILALYLIVKTSVCRILGLYIALIAINMGVSFYIDSGLFESEMYFISMWRIINTYLLLGPILLAFVLYMFNGKRCFKKRELWHLLPFTLSLINSILLLSYQSLPFLDTVAMNLQKITEHSLNDRFSWGYLLPALHFITYLLISSWIVFQNLLPKNRVYNSSQIWWLVSTLGISVLMMLSTALVFIISIIMQLNQTTNTFAISNLSTVVGFFGLTYLLIRFGPPVGYIHQTEGNLSEVLKANELTANQNKTSATYNKQHELSDEQKQNLYSVDQLMINDKVYLDPEFSQLKMAEALKLTRHSLSEILSYHTLGNFYELINHYRIAAVVEAIKTRPVSDNLINIAYDCGFSSKSTFNQVFKKHYQQTPSQYRKSINEK